MEKLNDERMGRIVIGVFLALLIGLFVMTGLYCNLKGRFDQAQYVHVSQVRPVVQENQQYATMYQNVITVVSKADEKTQNIFRQMGFNIPEKK